MSGNLLKAPRNIYFDKISYMKYHQEIKRKKNYQISRKNTCKNSNNVILDIINKFIFSSM